MSIQQTTQSLRPNGKQVNYDSEKDDHQQMLDENNQKESFAVLSEQQERLILANEVNKNKVSQFALTEFTEKERQINLLNKEKKIYKDTFFDKFMRKKSENQEHHSQEEEQHGVKKAGKPGRKPRGNPHLKRGTTANKGGRRGAGRKKNIKQVIVDDSKQVNQNQNQNGDQNNQKNGKRSKWKRKRIFSMKRTNRRKQVDESDYDILHIESVQLIPKRRRPSNKRKQNKLIQIQSSGASQNQKAVKRVSNNYPISAYSQTQNQKVFYQTKQEMEDYEKFLLLFLMEQTTGLNGMLSQMILKSSIQDINLYFKQNITKIYELCQPFCQFYKQNPSAIKQIKLQNCQYGQHIKGFIKKYIKAQKSEHISKPAFYLHQKMGQQKDKVVQQKATRGSNSKANSNSCPSNEFVEKKLQKNAVQNIYKDNKESDISESVKQEAE